MPFVGTKTCLLSKWRKAMLTSVFLSATLTGIPAPAEEIVILSDMLSGPEVTTQSPYADKFYATLYRHQLIMQQPENTARFDEWIKQFEDLKDKPLAEKVAAVQTRINHEITYTLDYWVHGQHDYWASALETLQKKQGDCEDFSVLKYETLKALGVDEMRLRIVILDVPALYLKHAVLAVDVNETPSGHPRFVLLSDPSQDLADIKYEYHPVAAVNARGVWSSPPSPST